MKYAFYISGKGGRLCKILEQDLKMLKDTVLVFSDSSETDYMEEMLEKRGIRYCREDYISLAATNSGRGEKLSDLLLRELKDNGVTYCFSFGAHLLEGQLLEEYKNKIINFHPSLLPKYPGINAIDQALRMDEKVLGNTAHFIDAGMDTGTVILKKTVPREVFDKYGYDRVLDYQIGMLEQIVGMIEAGKL